MSITMPRLALAVAAIAASAAAAQAATPEEGSVSAKSPKVEWNGALFNSGPIHSAKKRDPSAPCPEGEQCDHFTLTVGDAGTLVLSVGNSSAPTNGAAEAGIHVETPDGETVSGTGDSSTDAPYVLRLEAKPGEYLVQVTDSVFGCCAAHDYWGSAELKPRGGARTGTGKTPAPTGSGGGSGGGGTGGGGGEQPAPAPAPGPPSGEATPPPPVASGFSLTVKKPRVSARRARRGKRFAVRVTTTRPVQKLTATLKKGKRTVASGRKSAFRGKGSIRVKVKRKLKPGTYRLQVVATDGGVKVSRTIKLRVRR